MSINVITLERTTYLRWQCQKIIGYSYYSVDVITFGLITNNIKRLLLLNFETKLWIKTQINIKSFFIELFDLKIVPKQKWLIVKQTYASSPLPLPPPWRWALQIIKSSWSSSCKNCAKKHSRLTYRTDYYCIFWYKNLLKVIFLLFSCPYWPRIKNTLNQNKFSVHG